MSIKTPWTQDIEACKKGGQLLSLHELETKADAYRQGVRWTLESEAVSGLRVALEHLVRDLPDPRDAQEGKKALAALERLRKETQE